MKGLFKIILALGIGVVVVGCSIPEVKYYHHTGKTKIIGLKSGSGVTGHFSLGFGSIQDVDYYFFFIEDTLENGLIGHVKHKIPALEAVLIETDSLPPHLVHYNLKKETVRGEEIYTEFQEYSFNTEFLEGIAMPEEVKYRYELYVPSGTITDSVTWEAF